MLGAVGCRRAGRTAAISGLAVFAIAAISGCRSTASRLDTLEQLHADDGAHVGKIRTGSFFASSIDSMLGVVHLAPTREPSYETVENPCVRCQEEILGIGGREFDSIEQLGSAVAILSKIALRDRSHVSRAHAIFSLRQVALNWVSPAARKNPWDVADPQSARDAFKEIRSIHADDGRHKADVADADTRCLAAMKTAASARYGAAGDARAMLTLFSTFRRIESSATIRASIDEGIPRLAVQTIVLTLVEALGDDRDYVRRDAAEGLGLIGAKETAAPLCTALASEKDTDARWAILRALARLADPASTAALLAVAARPDVDATTRACAFQALRAATRKPLGDDLAAWTSALAVPPASAPGRVGEVPK
ncbi:MAG: HEAT repeat domain-containing protein [Planctomycetes bacterium]|nr:HEAT repeat domain-containing protein [Planctomycetota bacterium]MBI3844635.1 HEAT repeat domain-containing protein [Planctomycetota bacterium]